MPRPPTRALRFTRLKLTNWRNFRSVDVRLEERNFIVGPNASGKSNLLDAIRFLAEIAHAGSGGLGAAIASRGGLSMIRCLNARKPPWIALEAFVGTTEQPDVWQYLIQMNLAQKGRLAVIDRERVQHGEQVLIDRTRGATDDLAEFGQSSLEQVAINREFRDLATFFSSCRYLHVVPQIVRDRARARDKGDDPFGGDLLRRMKDMPAKTRDPRLRRISAALTLAVPQFEKVELEDDSAGVPHLIGSYKHWRPHAFKHNEVLFSDGTLRLIGLLWSISEKGGPLLLEEPELSLNDAVVSELPKMLAGLQKLSSRQVICTTHSSALLDGDALGLKEVHLISVDGNGSSMETLSDNARVSAQVGAGMTISEAVLPLLRPKDVLELGKLTLAA